MNWRTTGRKLIPKFKPKRYTSIVMMLIIWTGLASALFAGISTNIHSNDSLIGRAVTVADSISAQEVESLQGNGSDMSNINYRLIKERFQKIRSDNHDLSFIYLMGQKQGRFFYFVDSDLAESPTNLVPGQTYNAPTLRLKTLYNSHDPFIDGLHRDQFGLWITSYAPIINSKTKEVIAVVAINVPAINYYERILLYSLIPLLLAAIPFIGLMRDRKLEEKEHELAALKNQFVSIASHELRSPLTGMVWALQSLLQSIAPKISPREQQLLHDTHSSASSSLATVEEILDMSIFERGKAHNLHHDPTDLISVLKEVINTLKLNCHEKHIVITFKDVWPLHASVLGDNAALKRAFMNIISNAIKYSPQDSTIDVVYRHTNQQHIITVVDHGIGIPAAEQQKVLEGYYRASNAAKLQSHGTGLGLWLSRMLIEEHGGRIWLRSHLNKGTALYIALPDVKGIRSKSPETKKEQA
ncbi:MAG: hypothetical protein NVSMB46_05060 [Candidatus Saccharimonadales bacterium]